VRVALITTVAGRADHLARQVEGMRASLDRPQRHVVVALDATERESIALACPRATEVTAVASTDGRLPLAAARNAGAEHALDAGADLLVFLDVDCIPGPDLFARYSEAARATDRALLCGPVSYLPPPPDGGYDLHRLHDLGAPHPARPLPGNRELVRGGDHALFWSLSFALTRSTWSRIGGFCEAYSGYGGEDTDFGQLARRAGVDLCWVGGAWAYHQHHLTASPPVEHLDDILRNAALFHARWGWWPMTGWLGEFARAGLVRHDRRRDRWELIRSG
jgi:GT2 family glycosyltransferase